MVIFESLNINIISDILLLVMILFIIEALPRRKKNKLRKEKENVLIKKQYPNLSDKELKFRETSINSYFRINYKGFSHAKFSTFIMFMIIIIIVISFKYLFAKDPLGITFCYSILLLCVSAIALTNPKYEKQRNFWSDYLREHPDNPLKVILFPADDYNKAVKSAKISGIIYLICGIFFLCIAFMFYLLSF